MEMQNHINENGKIVQVKVILVTSRAMTPINCKYFILDLEHVALAMIKKN